MSFRYSYTFPIAGPNKIPRFKKWAAEHAPEIEVSLPPQVPVKSNAMTIRVKSPEDRNALLDRMKNTEF